MTTPQTTLASTGPAFKIAKVREHSLLAQNYHYFVLETEKFFKFIPGQYVSVKVADQRINSYSIAGPSGQNRIELLVDTTPKGMGSQYFERLKKGETVEFLGPFGKFGIKDDDSKEIIFVATGSGIAPLRPMIKTILKDKDTPTTLYFGLRYETDVFWKEEFEKLEQENPNFHFKLCLSNPEESWKGIVGRVTDQLSKDYLDAYNISAYLCGNKVMIEEVKTLLAAINCPADKIYQEKFD